MTAHAWVTVGRCDDGTPRRECSACGYYASMMPEAVRPCTPEMSVDDRAIRRIPPRAVPPAAKPKTRKCALCTAAYAPMSSGARYCSHECSETVRRRQVAESNVRIGKPPRAEWSEDRRERERATCRARYARATRRLIAQRAQKEIA